MIAKSKCETYRDLISEKNFLRVQERAGELGGISFINADATTAELYYSVPSSEGAGNYDVRVIVDVINENDLGDLDPMEANQRLRQSNLHVNCNCPAFGYWGFKYIGTAEDYSIENEGRYPDVRNPNLQGYVCKHIYKVLQAYPFNINDIRKALVTEWR